MFEGAPWDIQSGDCSSGKIDAVAAVVARADTWEGQRVCDWTAYKYAIATVAVQECAVCNGHSANRTTGGQVQAGAVAFCDIAISDVQAANRSVNFDSLISLFKESAPWQIQCANRSCNMDAVAII